MKKCLSMSFLLLSALFVRAGETDSSSPYGICAHVSRGGEFEVRNPTYKLANQAGIRWMRSDFDWRTVEKEPGKWDFSLFDAVVTDAEKNGIQILPILGYSTAAHHPAHEHLDQWGEYVKRLVSHFGKRLPVVEIWNEENIPGFWKDPNPTNYLKVLKKSYETVKAIDPALQVAVGGFAGVPLSYIEELYKVGGKAFFDIMNVHPYSHPAPADQGLTKKVTDLRAVMEKYGDGRKPIWFTEIGWPTTEKAKLPAPGLLSAALKKANPKQKRWTILYTDFSNRGDKPLDIIVKAIEAELPKGSTLRVCAPDHIEAVLASGQFHALMYPLNESFPADSFPAVLRFVQNGGTLIDFGGMPIWNAMRKNAQGFYEHDPKVDAAKMRRQLRIFEEAWWTNKRLPEETQAFTTEATKGMKLPKEGIEATRFFSPKLLKEGDTFIPLLTGKGKEEIAAAIYQFNSDYKGTVIVSGLFNRFFSISSEAKQARMFTQSALQAFALGIEKFFWYELTAPEQNPYDPESFFGIVHKDFAPKPAYQAYKTLTQMRPNGSSQLREQPWNTQNQTFYHPQWQRPDKTIVGALWTNGNASYQKVTFSSDNISFMDHLGNPVPCKMEGKSVFLQVTDAPLYFVGGTLTSILPAEENLAQLQARIPALFSHAATQYRGLLKQMEGTKDRFPRRWENGKLITVDPREWTSGFFPGSLWFLFEATGDTSWKTAALHYTAMLEQIRHYNGNHDIGFMLYCSAGNGLRLANPEGYREILLDAAAALCTRYVPQLGMIRSWNGFNNPVIIDNMMNLELLMWAAKNGGDKRFEEIARSHANQTNLRHFRPNGSAYHIVDYNPRSGKIYAYHAGQGASADGPWARGQSWALYGFTMMYRETKDPAYLTRALHTADFLIGHPNLPADKIPYWDYEAANIPHAPRDASAGAIMASALLELSTFAPSEKAKVYRDIAVKQISSLASPVYLAQQGENGNFLLRHCVGHLPGNSEIDIPLNYADYYFLEALLRLQKVSK